MVLEEEIYFSNQEIAREFVRVLKEQGISSQIRQKMSLDIRLMLSGTYTHLTAMLDEVIGGEGAGEEEIEGFSQTQKLLTSQRDLISQAFERYQIGDRVGAGAMDLITGDRTIEGTEDEDTLDEIIEEMYLTRLLHLNDLLETDETGFRLGKKIEPDNALLTIFADEIPEIPDVILLNHEIKSTITAGDDDEWKVTIGPDIIFIEDLSPIEAFFEENDYAEEEGAVLLQSIQIKHLIISEIFARIREKGNVSRDEIREELSEHDIETGEEESDITLNLSTDFIDAVLDDLKKAGVIKGKDQKLRMAL